MGIEFNAIGNAILYARVKGNARCAVRKKWEKVGKKERLAVVTIKA